MICSITLRAKSNTLRSPTVLSETERWFRIRWRFLGSGSGSGSGATAPALVQHAYLADETPCGNAAEFARGIKGFRGLRGGDEHVVLGPAVVDLSPRRDPGAAPHAGGQTVRYAAETTSMLRAMKETAIAEVHAFFRRATTEEGLTAEEALRRCGLPARCVSPVRLVAAGEQPRCLANMSVDRERLHRSTAKCLEGRRRYSIGGSATRMTTRPKRTIVSAWTTVHHRQMALIWKSSAQIR